MKSCVRFTIAVSIGMLLLSCSSQVDGVIDSYKTAHRDLQSIDLSGQDLSGMDLSRENMADAKLSGTKLASALLWSTNLQSAQLIKADLRGADLRGSVLRGANLTGANLTGANLTGANLDRANLTGANLTGANLSDANLSDATFKDAKLTGVILPCWDYTRAKTIDPKVVSNQPSCVTNRTPTTSPSPSSTVPYSGPLCLNKKTTSYYDHNRGAQVITTCG